MVFGDLMIMPAIVMGLVISIVNVGVMLKDASGPGGSTIGHGVGAFFGVIILTFLSMNYTLFLAWFPAIQGGILGNEIVIRIALGSIAGIYIHIHSSAFKGARGAGSHETWLHSFGLGILIAASPYLWLLIGPMLPAWAQ
tara:strand:+ start:7619 stop:8038 length:420 start_codon:yes stop_codon:yes gene_type:complete